MYVCVTLRNAIYAAGGLPGKHRLRTFCRTLILAYYSGMDNEDEKRSRRLATQGTHGYLPTSDLAVEATMTVATAVTTQCTLALGEGPATLQNLFELGFQLRRFAIFPSSKDAVVRKKGMWYGLKCTTSSS